MPGLEKTGCPNTRYVSAQNQNNALATFAGVGEGCSKTFAPLQRSRVLGNSGRRGPYNVPGCWGILEDRALTTLPGVGEFWKTGPLQRSRVLGNSGRRGPYNVPGCWGILEDRALTTFPGVGEFWKTGPLQHSRVLGNSVRRLRPYNVPGCWGIL